MYKRQLFCCNIVSASCKQTTSTSSSSFVEGCFCFFGIDLLNIQFSRFSSANCEQKIRVEGICSMLSHLTLCQVSIISSFAVTLHLPPVSRQLGASREGPDGNHPHNLMFVFGYGSLSRILSCCLGEELYCRPCPSPSPVVCCF